MKRFVFGANIALTLQDAFDDVVASVTTLESAQKGRAKITQKRRLPTRASLRRSNADVEVEAAAVTDAKPTVRVFLLFSFICLDGLCTGTKEWLNDVLLCV
jgi:hypothetical protein